MPSILVPLDGSPLAEYVLPYVRYLATILAAQVQLLQVVSDADKEALLDDAAIQTIVHGGTVYAVTPADLPDAAPLAAIFRY